ncbi:fimbrial protein [Klebsiella pneumoniae]|uniref:Fimbrial protein n=1 Tax=Klebsiella pneumoniae TaxID=573 RepID=A0A2X3CVG9_KLEPN|nr:fimbrial protein [Klebsiella pneumoniae]
MNMRDGSTRGLLVASLLLLSLPALAYEGSSTVNFNVTGTSKRLPVRWPWSRRTVSI